MPKLSLFNDVLGPIMIGPSSSHTAGPNRIGRMARALLGERPVRIRFTFDPVGSMAYCYRGQGSDKGYVGGLLGMETDNLELKNALRMAREAGVQVEFETAHLDGGAHPNTSQLELWGPSGRQLRLWGVSVGGGMIVINRLWDYEVELPGDYWEVLLEVAAPGYGAGPGGAGSGAVNQAAADRPAAEAAGHRAGALAAALAAALAKRLEQAGMRLWSSQVVTGSRGALINLKLEGPPPQGLLPREGGPEGVTWVGVAPPVLPVPARPDASPLFSSATEMVAWAEAEGQSLGEAGLRYEMNRAGWSREEANAYMDKIWAVMRGAAERGLTEDLTLAGGLVKPVARQAETARLAGRMLAGGPVSRGVVLSLAVMEVNNAMGVVCAAPTAGSCGVIPGAVMSAAEATGADAGAIRRALFAAGAIGLVIARRATFAAEVAGCQAEVGAASAMAAAALVELAGGTARMAEESASVALQNTLGLICDPVASLVEVPCFGKNSMGVTNAYAAADMILGGYRGLIPFDEVADAMLRVGQMMPREVRCTALGGVAATPTGQKLANQYQMKLIQLEDWT